MSKYGKIELGVPDIKEDLAAIDDLISKDEITSDKGARLKDKAIRDRLMYIAKTNGAYTPGKKQWKEYNRMLTNLSEAKKIQEGMKQQKNREQFIEALKEAQETAKSKESTD